MVYVRKKTQSLFVSLNAALLATVAIWLLGKIGEDLNYKVGFMSLVVIFICVFALSFLMLNFSHTLNSIGVFDDRLELKFALMEKLVIPIKDIKFAKYPVLVGRCAWFMNTKDHGKIYFLSSHEFSASEKNEISNELIEVLKNADIKVAGK